MKRWCIWFLFSILFFFGCAQAVTPSPEEGLPGEMTEGSPSDQETTVDDISAAPTCDLNTLGYPVMDRRAYEHIYAGRSFYADGNHLGLDLAYPEGTPVYPIGPGIIRAYRSATGYGTLVVVVEHCTITNFEARDGFGDRVTRQSFLTIYGHLRKSSLYSGGRVLPWRVGDRVTPYDIIGYVQRDSDNGDGAEHVHLGVRLQTMAEAMASDPTAWFRGYDGMPSQRRFFADPDEFFHDLSGQIELAEFPGAYVGTPFPPDAGAPRSPVDAGSFIRDVGPVSRDTGSVGDVSPPLTSMPDVPRPPVMDAGTPPPPIEVCGDGRCQPTNFENCANCATDCGACPFGCAAGLHACSGSCVGFERDPNNCGGCGVRCAVGQSCSDTHCVWPMPPPMSTPDAGRPLMSLPDVPVVPDAGSSVTRPREVCNGLDDDGNGAIDETFLCQFGRQVDLCSTSCGSLGYLQCEAPLCQPGTVCHTFAERCTGNADEDCDGLRDCADPDCMRESICLASHDAGTPTPDVSLPPPPIVDAGVTLPDVPIVMPPPSPIDAGPPPVVPEGVRYEFRVLDSGGWGATEPFRLRDRWWATQICVNTGTSTMETRPDGWHRCDLRTRLTPFVGSFFSPAHLDWGDSGNLGTIGNAPERCTPTAGVEWRITDLATNVLLYNGPAAGLPCQAVGSQDRHALP